VIRHCGEIEADIENFSQAAFEADGKTQRAVYMSLHQIGELVARLPEAFKAFYPELPWRGIRQMRNIISHEYIQIDRDIIWQTVTQSIPGFAENIAACLRAIADGNAPAIYEKDN